VVAPAEKGFRGVELTLVGSAGQVHHLPPRSPTTTIQIEGLAIARPGGQASIFLLPTLITSVPLLTVHHHRQPTQPALHLSHLQPYLEATIRMRSSVDYRIRSPDHGFTNVCEYFLGRNLWIELARLSYEGTRTSNIISLNSHCKGIPVRVLLIGNGVL
jgi:hypothetical protein